MILYPFLSDVEGEGADSTFRHCERARAIGVESRSLEGQGTGAGTLALLYFLGALVGAK